MSPLLNRSLRIVLAGGCLACLLTVTANAQRRDVPRIAKRNSDALSRFLNETERRDHQHSRNHTIFDRSQNVDASRINMTSVRTMVTRLADDAARLNQQLDIEADTNGQLRSIMSDVLKFRARSAMMAQDISSRDARGVASSFREIDSDWRSLSYNLKHVSNLRTATRDTIAALDRTSGALEKIFTLDPQVNRRELISLVLAMRSDFDNLVDDIELELGDTPEARSLVRKTRSIRQHTVYAADLISDGGDYNRIVRAYARAEEDWRPVAHQLTQIDNRYIERSLRRIVNSGTELKQLLWLDDGKDLSQLIEVGDRLRKHVDDFARRAPLLLMLELDNPGVAVEVAKNFLGACDVYTDSVRANAEEETMMAVFQDLSSIGDRFINVFDGLPSRNAQSLLAEIKRDLDTIHSLTHNHQRTGGFDVRQATEYASEMETLAEHIGFDLNDWLKNSREPYRDTVLQTAKRFVDGTRDLHTRLSEGRINKNDVRQRTITIYEDWRRVSKYLERAPERDRRHLSSLATKVTNVLYDLMIPLDL